MIRCQSCDATNHEGLSVCETCGTAISAVCSQCGAGNPPLAKFCCGCGSRLEILTQPPQSERPKKPERRQITVVFCDLVNSSALAQAMDPEDWHRLLHRLHTLCSEIVLRRQGYVAQYLGDGLLAYFGYPLAREDSARQAVATGLEVAREVSQIDAVGASDLRLRVGIHTGSVVIGTVGAPVHREWLAFGQTPYLAFRIQEVTPAGGVVLSPDTYRLVKGYFEVQELGDFRLKGFDTQRLKLYQVMGGEGPTSRIEAAAALTPLVGRRAECTVLEEAWRKALAGAAPTLLLLGEPGIGKSRLIHTLKTQLEKQQVQVTEMRCAEQALSTAFHPVLECLQRRVGIHHGEAPDSIIVKLRPELERLGFGTDHVGVIASLLGTPVESTRAIPPDRQREVMFEALSAWILGHAMTDPRLIVVEDLHWADPSTLELLKRLAQSRTGRRVLLLWSARTGFSNPVEDGARSRVLLVPRLGHDDARAVIASVASDKSLPTEIVDRLAARAEGIPFFLEEMTKATIESGAVRETSAGYVLEDRALDSAVPGTLQDSLMARLDRLGDGKSIVQLAAVLGREFGLALFRAVWHRVEPQFEIDLDGAFERLAGAQLIAPAGKGAGGIYQFTHSLVQDFAYQSLLRSDRQEYHRHVGRALVEDFPARADIEPEIVAYHFAAAGRSEEASAYWSKAGERALRASAYTEAISHFNAALKEFTNLTPGAQSPRAELELRSRLGTALIATQGFASSEVEKTFARAAELCAALGDQLPVRVLRGTWVVNLVRGDLPSTQTMVPGLERLVEHTHDDAHGLILNAMLGSFSFFRGDFPKAVEQNGAGVACCDTAQPREQHRALLVEHGFEGFLYPAMFLAWCQTLMGDIDKARQTWRDALALSERIGDPYVSVVAFAFGAAMNHDLNDFESADELATRTRELCQEKGFALWLALATIIGGSCMVAKGAVDQAIAQIQEGLKLLRTIGDNSIYTYYLSYLANAYLKADRPDQATGVLDEALALTQTHVVRFCKPELVRLLGEARVAQGQPKAGRDCLVSALDLSGAAGARLYELRSAVSLARLSRSMANTAEASTMLNRVRKQFGRDVKFPLLRQADHLLESLEHGDVL
jgi:class 3 adenylate cyclase/tetratricopeptide (TPR) repeat protein